MASHFAKPFYFKRFKSPSAKAANFFSCSLFDSRRLDTRAKDSSVELPIRVHLSARLQFLLEVFCNIQIAYTDDKDRKARQAGKYLEYYHPLPQVVKDDHPGRSPD